ncbi:MAG: hypothetical protein ABI091_28435 [Ferruginibacter sp.]
MKKPGSFIRSIVLSKSIYMIPDFEKITPDLFECWTKNQLIDFAITLLDEIEDLKTHKELLDVFLRMLLKK